MERVIILKEPSAHESDEYALMECLRILFPDCTIDILEKSDEIIRSGVRR